MVRAPLRFICSNKLPAEAERAKITTRKRGIALSSARAIRRALGSVLVNYLRWHRCLDQSFAPVTEPIVTDGLRKAIFTRTSTGAIPRRLWRIAVDISCIVNVRPCLRAWGGPAWSQSEHSDLGLMPSRSVSYDRRLYGANLMSMLAIG